MIPGFFLSILVQLVTYVVQLLPISPLPAGITTAWVTIWGYMNALSFLFPVVTLLQVLVIGIGFQVTTWVWNMSHLIIRIIRGR